MKIAIPVVNGQINQHFGHSAQFAIVAAKNGKVEKVEVLDTPQQGHGFIPGWLAELGVSVALVGGMGAFAQQAMQEQGIKVVGGIAGLSPVTAAEHYLLGILKSGQPACGDHGATDHAAGHSCGCNCG